jgi:hypothetical protein
MAKSAIRQAKRRAAVKTKASGKIDRDTEIVVAVVCALAKSTPSPALRKRLDTPIGAALLEAFKAPDAPDSTTDSEGARRYIVAAARKGVIFAVNDPDATPRRAAGGN